MNTFLDRPDDGSRTTDTARSWKISVVCPTYNEAENIPILISTLQQALQGFDHEIIISDDDSPDRTWACAEAIAQREPHLRVLRRTVRRGLGWSVIDGFSLATADVVACMDADMQHDARILPQMIEELSKGADLVIGSRYVQGGSPGDWRIDRRAQSWLATKAAQWALGIKIADPMSGFFLMRRSDFLKVRTRLDGRGFKILLELVAYVTPAKVTEVPYTFRPRHAGHSKLSSGVILSYLMQLWRLRNSRRVPRWLGTFREY